jgi:hypothetical protein
LEGVEWSPQGSIAVGTVLKRARTYLFTAVLSTCILVLIVCGASDAGLADFRSAADSGRARAARVRALPKVVLWAWERPEDLRFANPKDVGVAFLAQTIFVSDRTAEPGFSVRARLQPLRFAAGAQLIGVTRIEARDAHFVDAKARLEKASAIARAIANTAAMPDIAALQIDFDTAESQRDFYRELLIELRAQLPEGMPISITALASWCTDDDWLEALPVDEAVPMLFRMGADGRNIRSRITSGEEFRASVCRGSVGVSTDEKFLDLRRVNFSRRRIYLFDPRPWNAAAFHEALRGESQ